MAPAMVELANLYMKQNPNVTVKITIDPWNRYWTKLESSITGDVAPDVFWINAPHLIKYATAGIVEPAEDVFTPEMRKKIAQHSLELYEFQNKLWAVPFENDTIGIFYNKKIFDKYQIPYPRENWTWNEFILTLEKLKSRLPAGMYPLNLVFSSQATVYPFIASAGGHVILKDKKHSGFNEPNTLDAIKKITSLYQKGYTVPLEASINKKFSFFLEQKAAMAQIGVWNTPLMEKADFAKDIGTTTIPIIRRKGNTLHAVGIAVSKNSPVKKLAKDFLRFAASDVAYKIYAEHKLGIPPVAEFNSIYKNAIKGIDVTPFIDAVAYATPFPYSYDTQKWESYMMGVLKNVFTGRMTPKRGTRKIYKEMTRILGEEKY